MQVWAKLTKNIGTSSKQFTQLSKQTLNNCWRFFVFSALAACGAIYGVQVIGAKWARVLYFSESIFTRNCIISITLATITTMSPHISNVLPIFRAPAADMAAAVRGEKEQDEKNIMEDQEDWQDHPWTLERPLWTLARPLPGILTHVRMGNWEHRQDHPWNIVNIMKHDGRKFHPTKRESTQTKGKSDNLILNWHQDPRTHQEHKLYINYIFNVTSFLMCVK